MNDGASKNNRKWVLDGRPKETRDPYVGWRDCKHLASDDSIGSDECRSTNKQYSSAGRQAMCIASLLCKKDHGVFVFFVFFVVMGRSPKWPRPLGTKIGNYDR
jgi:hypothetical protein